MEYYSVLRKEVNPTFCNNMDEPGGHGANWNKPDTEGQMLHGTTYTEYLE